ncbi:hypothetical protein [Stomatobaculum longum]|jgi:hypothetical protein|uniref:hypothetical protein n=1 Tax=Stomatobaculum longum TaxID=796942 RepID=UPI0028ED3602|nr:hypothetical protein [Stomatobaculum longum]
MDFIQDRAWNTDFSLQSSRVKAIKFHNKILTFKLDRIFRCVEGEEVECPGEFRFEGCDLDLCRALIFNKTLGEGRFTGKALPLWEFMDGYGNAEFEIVTEGYCGNMTTYSGWFWEAEKAPVSAILYLWNRGNRIYRIEE